MPFSSKIQDNILFLVVIEQKIVLFNKFRQINLKTTKRNIDKISLFVYNELNKGIFVFLK